MKILIYIICLTIPILSGCASILGSTSDTMIVDTKDDEAYIKILNLDKQIIEEGKPPLIVNLKKGHGYFRREHYTIVSQNSYGEKKSYKIVPGISPLYFLSILIPGGPIGMITLDAYNGSMWSFYDKDITID